MSGRISDIVIHPLKRHTWYVAVGSGGVWKTENAGTTWTPVFDAQPSYSIGCVTLDPSNPEIVWVGTGENVSGRHVGFGDGVYRSPNGGKTWTNMGLTKSEHIGRILVDPRDPDVVFVAAEGPLWSAGGERGLYKTADGGKTWALVLEISKDTGVTSVEFDPANPDILYAAAYQRRRSVAAFMGGGPESGIHKSEDGGKTWRKLTVGLPKGDVGKIGLAVSPIDPHVVYATVEAGPEEKGFYRSADRGESWEKRSDYISGGTGPHYYQEIFADPTVFDRVYQMDPGLRATDDGGKTWRRVDEANKHGDNHAMAFVKGDPGYILNGSDGGVYETRDGGKTWRFFENLPVTQFYKLALDNALPFYNVHGGAQDNGSQLGPSRTANAHGISNADWTITYGADGYATAIDPTDPNTVYLEWQIGNLLRYDKKSHETVYISPKPEPGDPPLRFNWDSPVAISPFANTRLYYAGQFVWRSEDRGDSWTRISPDLTRGIFRLEQKIMGRQWSVDGLWDHGAMSQFGTITSLSESRLAEGLIYAGTDDGLIQVTEDGGKSWRKIDKVAGVPDYFFVNKIMASKHDKDTVYAAIDNHKTGDYKPYLMMSADRGRTWTNIAGGLPQRTIVWSVAQDHVAKDLLFAGTEFGIYATLDGGKAWVKLGGGVPTISFRDIEVQEREGDLVGASFGRGFFVLDDYSPLREMSEAGLAAEEAVLFPAKKALRYVPLRPIDSDAKGCLGDAYYVAPNPPFGAVFTYYLKDGVKSAAEARREAEAKLVKDGKPVPFPGWDSLRSEENEEKPVVVLTVADEAGEVVRRMTVPAAKGLHRVAWNLRYPAVEPTAARGRAARVVGAGVGRADGRPGHVHGHAAEEGRRHADDDRRAARVRRRIARDGQPAGEGQGGASRVPEEGGCAAAGDDGRGSGGGGRVRESQVHPQGAARRAQGRPEAGRGRAGDREADPGPAHGPRGRPDAGHALGADGAVAHGADLGPARRDGADHGDGQARLRHRGRGVREARRGHAADDRRRPEEAPGRARGRRRPLDPRPRRPRVEEINKGTRYYFPNY